MSKIVIIDGNSLLFRSFYATIPHDPSQTIMQNKEGIPTNAIFGFANMMTSLISSLNKDDAIFVAFDKGKHTFRHKQYPEYKANRNATPNELLTQMPIARELLDCLNITYYEDDNIEADDIAGIVAKKSEKEGYKVVIYTSDKDYLQLIDDNITVRLIKKGLKDIQEMTPTTFKEVWGFDPIQIIDYKGLMGDTSDNLKGIPKVGDKTAKTLIQKYGTLENILANADSQTKALNNNLLTYAEQGKICKSLATIQIDYPLDIDVNSLKYKGYDFNKITSFANHYEFKNLVNKLPKDKRIINNLVKKVEYKIVNDLPTDNVKEIGIDIDIENINYHEASLYGISITIDSSTYYIEINNIKNAKNLIEILKNINIKKYCYDYKKIKCVLFNNNITINGLFFDLLLGTYILEPSIKNDINQILAYYNIDINYCYKKEMALFEEGNKELSAATSYFSLWLYETIKNKLLEVNQLDLLNNIELPLEDVLADIEIEGFPINKNKLLEFKKIYEDKISIIKQDVYALIGHEFNINSTKELANVLYNELNLKGNKKHSTSVDYLLELKDEHPVIDLILQYRKYSKMLSTYIDGLLPFIKEDNKIHATFNQAITQTGRLSSSEPNLQNISIRDEESKQIRQCFYYDDPNLNILSLDYSQIELRILASLSNCTALINAFNNDEDIHSLTAKKIFNINREPTSLERRKAKAVNFGIVYGISDWGLAEQLNISIPEAKNIILSFNINFPEVKKYLNATIESASKLGYSTTIFNRRRYISEFNSSVYSIREFAKRAAMNAPIQGSAADLIKIAMINVAKALKENNLNAKIISQIHDELLIKVDDKEKDKVEKLVKDIMENCVKLNVKLKVDGGYAKTWFDAK